MNYLASLFAEFGARRKRMRLAFGDFGQSLIEFLVMSGLALGSLGLFLRSWMPTAAPWGFWLPLVFVVGYCLIDARRQQAAKNGAAAEKVSGSYDWVALLWSFGCALAGAATLIFAWSSPPAWMPPANTVHLDMGP